MADLAAAYEAWRAEPFPHGNSDDATDEVHADLVLADTWVAECVIPFVQHGRFDPAQIDVLERLGRLRDRATRLRDTEKASA